MDATKKKIEVLGNHELSLIHQLSYELMCSDSLNRFVEVSLKHILEIIAPDMAIIYELEKDLLISIGEVPRLVAFDEDKPDYKRIGQCLCGMAAEVREAIFSMDIQRDNRCTLNECKNAGFTSFAAIPLMGATNVVGVLGLASYKKRDFSEQTILLETMGSHIAIALEKEHMQQQLHAQAAQLTQKVADLSQTKETLQTQKDLLQSLFENVPMGVTVWCQDGSLLNANKGFYDLTGYDRTEICNLDDWFVRAYPEAQYRNHVIADWQAASDRSSAVREFKVVCKSGEVKDIEFRGVFTADKRALVTMTDISARKINERSLRESEARFRAHFHSAPVGMAIVDSQRRFLEVNRYICNILGYRPEELVGKSFNAFTHEEDRQGGRERWRELLAGDVDYNQAEKRYLHKSGRTVWALVSNALIRGEEGQPLYFVSHLLDISAQKQAQKETSRLERQLQQAQKMEAIGTLAGGIAHDFNNLLMGIQGQVSLMLLDLPPGHPHNENLKGIEDHVQSASDLTKQLLGIARGGKYEVKPCDLGKLVADSAAMFSRTRKDIILQTRCEPEAVIVEVDRRQIEQMLLNLYVNAWQAMPEGGKLDLNIQVVELDATFCAPHQIIPGHYARISVSDTGIGMDAVTQRQIFDPFFTTKEKGRGTGLGLASAYGIVKNHGGAVTVYSEVGHGTTFNVYLPLSIQDAAREELPVDSLVRGTETILFIDDEQMILEVGKSMLKKLGYRTLVAKGGLEAIEIVTEKGDQIDLIILDLIMPGVDGSQAFDRIRKLQPDLPIILSSGYAINGRADDIMQRGCDGFIQKPFNIIELSQKLRQILEATE